MSVWVWVWLQLTSIEPQGFCPLIATAAGHVVLGANLVGSAEPAPPGRPPQPDRDLTAPAEWYESLAGKRLRPGPGARTGSGFCRDDDANRTVRTHVDG